MSIGGLRNVHDGVALIGSSDDCTTHVTLFARGAGASLARAQRPSGGHPKKLLQSADRAAMSCAQAVTMQKTHVKCEAKILGINGFGVCKSQNTTCSHVDNGYFSGIRCNVVWMRGVARTKFWCGGAQNRSIVVSLALDDAE
ncbi:hypothetical protein V5F44_08750 [Xanthobacter sp. V2C-8]|uniref:hypothetical protein n=1 Tax=Xanthobacter albus TaxID=3119929 RepID=UPI003727F009